jgi:tetratricopeptide (TPR) repeat protein
MLRFRQSALVWLPAVVLLGIWLWWLLNDGGYFPRDHLPAGIVLVCLLAAVMLATGRVLPPGRAQATSVLAFAGLVAWTFASIAWAVSDGLAWEAADELLVLLSVVWVVALLPWDVRSAAMLLGAWSLMVAVVCAAALVSAIGADSLAEYVTEGRFRQPLGYSNATAALAAIAFWPALLLSYRREVPIPLQALCLAGAAFLAQFTLLPQTRAALLAFGVGAVVLALVAPGRLALAARAAVVAAAVAFGSGPILDVLDGFDAGAGVGAGALERAAEHMLLGSVVAGLAGALMGGLQQSALGRVELPRPGRRAVVAAAVVATLGVVVVGVLSFDAIRDRVSAARDAELDQGARISSLDPEERFDYWRVSLDMWRDAPIGGAGAGNFERVYTREREERKPARYAHNIWLRFLGETGLVGLLLFAGFLGAGVVGAFGARRRAGPAGQAIVAASLALTAVFLAHASLDWLDEVPALAAPALASLALAGRIAPASGETVAGRAGSSAAAAGICVAALLAVAALALPFLSIRLEERAFERYRAHPEAAFDDLDSARSLNPLSLRPLVSEGTIALSLGRFEHARRAFEEAVREEDNAYARLELALLAARRGDFATADAEIERARQLAPSDVFVSEAARRIAARRRIDPRAFNDFLIRESRSRFTRPQS